MMTKGNKKGLSKKTISKANVNIKSKETNDANKSQKNFVEKEEEHLELESNNTGGDAAITELEQISDVNRCDELAEEEVSKHIPSYFSESPPHLACTIIASYDGERGVMDEFSGYGKAVFIGGNIYEGTFSNGVMHGRGLYKWTNGTQFEGDFVCNKIKGYGRYQWPDDSFYEGDVIDGIRHGVGIFKTSHGVSYSGEWKNGSRHGKAIMNFSNDSWYKGDWVDNVRQGWGIRRYKSGNEYEGEWMHDKRHGEGTMRWITSNETYSGMWKDGIQHGFGSHTWFLQRVPGTQYLMRNEYIGEFCNSFRQGEGKFYFASGAVYSGNWYKNKKQGWGKFIFKNGRVFEGLFENDHMVDHPEYAADGTVSPDSAGIRTRTPFPNENACFNLEVLNKSMFGQGVSLDLTFILKDFNKEEHNDIVQQLSYLVLRNVSVLRRVYSFYSGLGHDGSLDNTFVMTKLQFWRFLKDCKIHHQLSSLINIDCLLSHNSNNTDIHNPMEKILLREFLNSVVILCYMIFKNSNVSLCKIDKMSEFATCFSKILCEYVFKNACKINGNFLFDPQYAVVGFSYMEKCWKIYHCLCKKRSKPPYDHFVTLRQFLYLFKDLKIVGKQLTIDTIIKVLSTDDYFIVSENSFSFDMEITFLEFFEALIGCANEFLNIPSKVDHKKQIDNKTEKSSSLAAVDNFDQNSVGSIQNTQSNFETHLGAAPTCGTGEFLQTLSEHFLNEEIENVTVKDVNESDKSNELVELSPEQLSFKEWCSKLNLFFEEIFFPRWDNLQILKEKIIFYRKIDEKKRVQNVLNEQQVNNSMLSLYEKVDDADFSSTSNPGMKDLATSPVQNKGFTHTNEYPHAKERDSKIGSIIIKKDKKGLLNKKKKNR